MNRRLRASSDAKRPTRNALFDIFPSMRENLITSKEEEIDDGYTLWDVARTGDIKYFTQNKLLDNVTRKDPGKDCRGSRVIYHDHTKNSLRKKGEEITCCAYDVINEIGVDLQKVLDKKGYSCLSCSSNRKRMIQCCIWCIENCHYSHLICEVTKPLKRCDCGYYKHDPMLNKHQHQLTPIDFPDSVF